MKSLLPTLCLLASLCGLLRAQEPESFPARAKAMIRKAVQSGNSMKILRSLCETAPGRLSGTASAERAVDWAVKTMKELGLSNVHREKIMVPRWVRGRVCSVNISGDQPAPLAAVALGGSVGTLPGGIEAEVVSVTSMRALRKLGKKGISGRIVLFNSPFDNALPTTFAGYGGAVWQRSLGAIEASMRGAVAVLVRSVTSAPDDVPHTGSMAYKDGVVKIPSAAISCVAADRLQALIKAGHTPRVKITLDCHMAADVPSANVVGEIPGAKTPDEIVLMGAHLDSWDICQGAQDDGAGVAHVLEAARLILATNIPPHRTIRVVLFMNEENGLRGGRGYFKAHQAEIGKHVLCLESDGGAGAPRGLGVTPLPDLEAAFQPFAQLMRDQGLGRFFKGGGGADISPLTKAGVPSVGFRPASDRYFDVHHSIKDTLDTVHPRELARGAGTIGAFISFVANLPQNPRAIVEEARRKR